MSYEFEEFAEKLVTILLERGIDIQDFDSTIFIEELKKIKQAE